MTSTNGEDRLCQHFKLLVVLGLATAALMYWLSVISYARTLDSRISDNTLPISGLRPTMSTEDRTQFGTLQASKTLRRQPNLSTPVTSPYHSTAFKRHRTLVVAARTSKTLSGDRHLELSVGNEYPIVARKDKPFSNNVV